MKAIHFWALSLGALAFVASPGRVGAQTTSPAVLNSLEVQELVKRAQPEDHARLEVHYDALAEKYAAEAKSHAAMGRAAIGSPINRTAANSAADHCNRLEQLNLKSAETARELAAYHKGMAAGKTPPAPRDAARFDAGAGAPAPTGEQIAALMAKAVSPTDHRAIQEYFLALAKQYTADANEHSATANVYRGTRMAQAAVHCDRLVAFSRDEAKEATAAAAVHQKLAGGTR